MAISQETKDIITTKKLQYCRFADSNQWDSFDKILTPDAICEFFESEGVIQNQGGVDCRFSSREEVVGFFSKATAGMQTLHVISPGEMEQTGPDEIKVIWGAVFQMGSKEPSGGMHGTGGGYFHETWIRKGDDWFLHRMKMMRTYWKVSGL
ncbi:hypothetical protein QQX98_000888 [Neonectria punicea]|uniref:SnoaL-like domain-containing protein n=1 Tax=Neonectria punicea TaxID=979145 RepID=A0ABR1HR45_9HYPO